MTVTYTRAPEVQEIADKLIAEHHTHLIDNGHVRIEYVFRSEAAESNGKTVFGKARKVSGLNAFLATMPSDVETAARNLRNTMAAAGGGSMSAKGKTVEIPAGDPWPESEEIEPFFVIEIAADVWSVLDRKQKIALVDHELCHLQIREDGKLALNPHDVEEFGAVLRRHGIWQEDLERFIKNLKGRQLSLLADSGE